MSARILDGKQLAASIREGLKAKVAALPPESVPGLAVVLAGEDPASKVYVRQKETMCREIGIRSFMHVLPETVSQQELSALIDKLNNDPAVHGILVQLPLPAGLDAEEILTRISPAKDVDGFHIVNVGKLWVGEEAIEPCTPRGVMAMLDATGVDLKGKEAVVIGRSNIVGKPVAAMLLSRHCTVTVCHSRTEDLPEVVRRADIVVAAIGKPKFVTAGMIKPGAIVIDVGINRGADGKLVGDVDYAPVAEKASWITPVPGGVGPMTIIMLMQNTLQLAGIR